VHQYPFRGALAQLVEHLLCKQDVVGSIPSGSTRKHTFVVSRYDIRIEEVSVAN
jgi:hypothetical protein